MLVFVSVYMIIYIGPCHVTLCGTIIGRWGWTDGTGSVGRECWTCQLWQSVGVKKRCVCVRVRTCEKGYWVDQEDHMRYFHGTLDVVCGVAFQLSVI